MLKYPNPKNLSISQVPETLRISNLFNLSAQYGLGYLIFPEKTY